MRALSGKWRVRSTAYSIPPPKGGGRATRLIEWLQSYPRTLLHLLRSPIGRFCCKSLFALVIKNFPGFRRDFRVKMRGTSLSDDKLADDLGNAIEGTRISGRRSDFSTAGKSAPGHLGLLQQYRHWADEPACPHSRRVLEGKRTLVQGLGTTES